VLALALGGVAAAAPLASEGEHRSTGSHGVVRALSTADAVAARLSPAPGAEVAVTAPAPDEVVPVSAVPATPAPAVSATVSAAPPRPVPEAPPAEPEPPAPAPEPEPEPEPVAAPSGSAEEAIAAYFPDVYDEAVAVASCESGMNPGAVSRSGKYHGLFQISTIHRGRVESMGYSWDQILDAWVNSAVARAIYDEQGWGPWGCKP
jgi:hypothetical protein